MTIVIIRNKKKQQQEQQQYNDDYTLNTILTTTEASFKYDNHNHNTSNNDNNTNKKSKSYSKVKHIFSLITFFGVIGVLVSYSDINRVIYVLNYNNKSNNNTKILGTTLTTKQEKENYHDYNDTNNMKKSMNDDNNDTNNNNKKTFNDNTILLVTLTKDENNNYDIGNNNKNMMNNDDINTTTKIKYNTTNNNNNINDYYNNNNKETILQVLEPIPYNNYYPDPIVEIHASKFVKTKVPKDHSKRFPSIEIRIKHYMGDWYLPPCENTTNGIFYYEWIIPSTNNSSSNNSLLLLQQQQQQQQQSTKKKLLKIYYPPEYDIKTNNPNNNNNNNPNEQNQNRNQQQQQQQRTYDILDNQPSYKTNFYWDNKSCYGISSKGIVRTCKDIMGTMNPIFKKQQQQSNNNISNPNLSPPLIFFLGDGHYNPMNLPYFRKVRNVIPSSSSSSPKTTITTIRSTDDINNEMNGLYTKEQQKYAKQDLEVSKCYYSKQQQKPEYNPNNKQQSQQQQQQQQQSQQQQSPTMEPIVWTLNTERHYGKLGSVRTHDKKWEHKKDKAVFRGGLTGSYFKYREFGNETMHNDILVTTSTDDDTTTNNNENLYHCMKTERCYFVYKYAKSKLIDAKLTSMIPLFDSKKNTINNNTNNNNTIVNNNNTVITIPKILNGRNLYSHKTDIKNLLKYKAIIMLDGNDIASGMKWALYSNSIVLMPYPPRFTTWGMEELLQPWIHFVPLKSDLSDVEEKMQWVLKNKKHAKQIIERATMWIHDLIYHPNAHQDDLIIQNEILKRYLLHYRPHVVES